MYNLPTSCSSCGKKLEWSPTGIDLYCRNVNCDAKNGRNLLHFFSVLNNLDGFGPKTIENLIEHGFDTIPKIYKMSYQDFQDCGYKHKTIMNLGTELEESKERELPDYRFLAALGIPDLGIGGSKNILEQFNLAQVLFYMKPEELILIDGFGDNKVISIFEYLKNNKELIAEIFNIGFNIIHEEIEVKESSITGKRICFTGKMESNRSHMQGLAGELGAIPVNAVNSKTDILVCGANVGANKTNAAKKHNTTILSEKEFFDLIK